VQGGEVLWVPAAAGPNPVREVKGAIAGGAGGVGGVRGEVEEGGEEDLVGCFAGG